MSFFGKNIQSKEPLSGQKLLDRALDLLSRRDHSERELFRKLQQKGAVVEELPELLSDLKKKGYLDDRRFSENFVRFRSGKAWGQRRYRQELLIRGVDKETVDSVLATLPEVGAAAVSEKLRRLVDRELAKGKAPEKIVDSLARRGFGHRQIREALSVGGGGDEIQEH